MALRRTCPGQPRTGALQRLRLPAPPARASARALNLLPTHRWVVPRRTFADQAHDAPAAPAAAPEVAEEAAPPRRPVQRGNKSVEETYKKMSQREHILLRPESYVGSTERNVTRQWVVGEDGRMTERDVSFVPALYKIFDEVLVNAADNVQRNRSTTEIRVTIDEKAGRFTVWNNGRGVPVKRHADEGVYVPEMVFGQLLTGSNFDDAEVKVVGGRNGFGAKLANIFSRRFRVETVDSAAGLRYEQEWRDNMTVRGEPAVAPAPPGAADYTLVEFEPDVRRLGVASLGEDDLLAVLRRRVYDVAACNEGVAVYLNGARLPDSFGAYVRRFGTEEARVVRVNERWEVGVGVAPADAGFTHVSFVNSIATTRGGTHVAHLADQVVKHMVERLNRTVKDVHAQPYMVRNQLFLFVNCLVENPAFDSQTKETLTTKPSAFGSRCILPAAFLRDVEEHTGIVQRVVNSVRAKQHADLLERSGGGRPRARLLNIPKLEDANEAAGPRAAECTLIITEGDSAKALAVAGLSELGRDLFGVFPLRGKLLNARDATHEQLRDNVELNNLIAILGLSYERKYEMAEELATLRYGRVMLMTDQDVDGSHIKGLFINFIHKFWPALLRQHAFVEEFITPILKATRGKETVAFFTQPEYDAWKRAQGDAISKWRVKYYKGLGTSTAAEAKAYFKDLRRHRIVFEWAGGDDADIEMAFSKHAADARKAWQSAHVVGTHVDHASGRLSFKDFIHKELVLFSRYDTLRCIPSAVDGLKPGQRKVLYGCLRRNLTAEVKVAQLAGYVAEHAGYHHGEAALHATIVGMAQDFVGANNLPLLVPVGQFGTRLAGGDDAASARYIFTQLAPHTRMLFDERDDPLLRYLDDDGFAIEPEYYVPIIPLVLVNGADGLGTGWSTQVPPHDPLDVIANLQRKLRGAAMAEMPPYWEGFTGRVERASPTQYVTSGRVEEVAPGTLAITELPVGRWTNDYKALLASLSTSHGRHRALVKDFREYHTNDAVHFRVTLSDAAKTKAVRAGLEKLLRLTNTFSLNNMHLFGADGKIHKFRSPLEIMEEHFKVRMHFYDRRKELLLATLDADVKKLRDQQRFSELVTSGRLPLFNVRRDALLAQLDASGFARLNGTFDHLLGTPLWSLTAERIARLTADRTKREEELSTLQARTPAALWEAVRAHSLHRAARSLT